MKRSRSMLAPIALAVLAGQVAPRTASAVDLIADLGGPINVSHLAADGTYPDSTNSETT